MSPASEERRYCFSCQTAHNVSEFRRKETAHGVAYVCRRREAAARRSIAERDQFGAMATAASQAAKHLAQKRARNYLLKAVK